MSNIIIEPQTLAEAKNIISTFIQENNLTQEEFDDHVINFKTEGIPLPTIYNSILPSAEAYFNCMSWQVENLQEANIKNTCSDTLSIIDEQMRHYNNLTYNMLAEYLEVILEDYVDSTITIDNLHLVSTTNEQIVKMFYGLKYLVHAAIEGYNDALSILPLMINGIRHDPNPDRIIGLIEFLDVCACHPYRDNQDS